MDSDFTLPCSRAFSRHTPAQVVRAICRCQPTFLSADPLPVFLGGGTNEITQDETAEASWGVYPLDFYQDGPLAMPLLVKDLTLDEQVFCGRCQAPFAPNPPPWHQRPGVGQGASFLLSPVWPGKVEI